jgi:hypothetical protein
MQEEVYSAIENSETIKDIIAPSSLIKGYIPFNRQVGAISFSLLSPKKTVMYLEWDKGNTLYPRRGKKIKFRRAGQYQTIVFNVTKPSSGYIYIYNSENKSTRKLLKKIRYLVKKENAYSQAISTSFNKQGSSGISADKKSEIDMSLSYSINERVSFGESSWSANVRMTSDNSVGMSFGYSW